MQNGNHLSHQKIELLKKLCEEYVKYLKAGKTVEEIQNNKKLDFDVVSLILSKLQITNQLHNILLTDVTPDDKIKEFQSLLHKSQDELRKNIDTDIVYAIKEIIDQRTLGGASKLGLWNVKGAEFINRAEHIISGDFSLENPL